MRTLTWLLLLIAAAIVAGAVLILLYGKPAAAHSDYPPECCGGTETTGDCRPVIGHVVFGGNYRFDDPLTHETWLASEREVRSSLDERYHLCQSAYAQQNHIRPLCFFVPRPAT